MRGFLFRDWLACGVLAAGIVLGAAALSVPAQSQSVAAKGDLDPTGKDTDRIVKCGMDFSTVSDLPGWRVIEGDKLQAYLSTLFTAAPNGDAMAYLKHGDKVALVLARNGCVVGRQVVDAKMHKKVIELTLGVVA